MGRTLVLNRSFRAVAVAGPLPNQANIYALKEKGCTHILATTACGSLKEEYKPMDFVIVDQFVDRTNQAREMITCFFVKKIQTMIPNAKVIGTGNTFYEIGSRLVMVTGDKDRVNTQGNLAKSIKEKSLSFGKGRSPDKLPDLILILRRALILIRHLLILLINKSA